MLNAHAKTILTITTKLGEIFIFNFQKLHPNDGQRHNDSPLCDIVRAQSVQLCRIQSANEGNAFAIKKTEIEGELCERCFRHEVSATGDICNRCREVLTQQTHGTSKICEKLV